MTKSLSEAMRLSMDDITYQYREKQKYLKDKEQEFRELGVPEKQIARIISAATKELNMRALGESTILEDNWWANKAKKAIGGITSKFSSASAGKLEARERAEELMHEYKKNLGSGAIESTLEGLLNWLQSGNDQKADAIVKQLKMKGNRQTRAAQISISDVRDFLVRYAALEMQGSNETGARSGLNKEAKPKPNQGINPDFGLTDQQVANIIRIAKEQNK